MIGKMLSSAVTDAPREQERQGRPPGARGFAKACKSLQTKAHGRSEIAKAAQSGAEVDHVHNGFGLAAAERHYGSRCAAVSGKRNEGRWDVRVMLGFCEGKGPM